MTEIKTQFVQFFSNLFNYRSKSDTKETVPQDDSFESLHLLACQGEFSALLKLGLMAQRSEHAYVAYLFADALRAINRYPLLMSYYYYRAFKIGHVANDPDQKKGAFLAAQALANFYDAGIYFPKNALFADHYRYEAACLNPDIGQAFLEKLAEKEASVSKIKLLQSSLVSLSLGDHEYAEKLLKTALDRPVPEMKTYFTALKNKIYIALGKRYEASGDTETAVNYYKKIKPQSAKEFIYAFQVANIYFYTLQQPEQAIKILSKIQPEITLPKTTENKDFFDYLLRWEKAWKVKERKEAKRPKKIVSRNFEEGSVNPLIEIYLQTPQGEKMMSSELLDHHINYGEDLLMQDLGIDFEKYKTASPFYQKVEELLIYEKKRLNAFSPELKEHTLYQQRLNEIEELEKALAKSRFTFCSEMLYHDSHLINECVRICTNANSKNLLSPYLSSFRWHGGNRLIEKLNLILGNVLNQRILAYRRSDLIIRAKEIEKNNIIAIMGKEIDKKDHELMEKDAVIAKHGQFIEKLTSEEILQEKEIEIDKLTHALNEKDRENYKKNKVIKKQNKTISEQSETIHRQLTNIDELNKKTDEQSKEIQDLNLTISKLNRDLAKSEKEILELKQDIVETTQSFEEKLEKQAEAHTVELDSIKKELKEKLKNQATSHATQMEENTKAFEEKLKNQATSHATQIDEMKRDLEENTKAFEEKLKNQATSHATQMDKMKKEFSEHFQALNKKINEQNQTLRNACAINTKNKDKIDEYETFIKNCGGETYILEMKENYENYKKDSELFKKYTSAKNVDTLFGKDQTMETLEDYSSLTCPITQMMIKDPVVAEDGYTYERSAIEKWFLKQKTSPMTGEPMGIALVENISLRNIISDFLNYNKSLLEKASEDNKPPLTTTVLVEKQALANNQHCFFSKSNSLPTEISVNSNFILGEEQETVGINNSF